MPKKSFAVSAAECYTGASTTNNRCDVVFDDDLLPALMETLAEACALPTRQGARPCLCVSTQKRNRSREEKFFADLATRLGGGEWRVVHRRHDLSVLIFNFTVFVDCLP